MASIALKRLLVDLREIHENPLPNIVALPANDDMFEWHANRTTIFKIISN
jgi:ubiquitin-protein ligase